ncbi:VOC family protein [Clostridium sp. YIM B02505]|uniref:VOC family protein n=1 Tax=Clostridium yunnanense TaxID=2800325 RepID=A0ABS1EWZ2_9CLOT|nr:VOC family protein [Clostridium yunnanense]MBK1813813.1 VOC family protein [Clostridium yunnanense]
MKLIEICVFSKDVEALANFYCNILSVECKGDSNFMELSFENIKFTIFSNEGMENMVPNSMKNSGSGNFAISIEVNDVDLEYERLKTMDIEFIKLPATHPWGTRSMWFRDIDGNIVNFVTVV